MILPSDKVLYDLMAETWLSYLESYSFETVQAAVYKYFDENMNQPGPKDILNQVKMFLPKDPSAPPSVEEAWAEVNGFIRSHGYMNAPKPEEYSNPAVGAAVNCLNWLDICTNENIEATRAHFFRAYAGYAQRKRDENSVKKIAGRAGNNLRLEVPKTMKQLLDEVKPPTIDINPNESEEELETKVA